MNFCVLSFQLLYFSIADDAFDGFLRALSVASGTHMPRVKKPKPSRPSSQARYGYQNPSDTCIDRKYIFLRRYDCPAY